MWFAAVGAYSLDLDVSANILTSDDEFSRVQQQLPLRILETVEAMSGCTSPSQHKPTLTTMPTRPRPERILCDLQAMEHGHLHKIHDECEYDRCHEYSSYE